MHLHSPLSFVCDRFDIRSREKAIVASKISQKRLRINGMLYGYYIRFNRIEIIVLGDGEEKDASWYRKYNNPTVIPQYVYGFRHLRRVQNRGLWNKRS